MRRIASRLLLCASMAAAAGVVCQTKAAEEGKQTVVVRLAQLNNDIENLRGRLSSTMAALEEVKSTAASNADLAGPYKNYSQSLAALEKQVGELRERGIAAKARAKEHWNAWEVELTSMQNPQLREKAQSRYGATVKEFQKIVERVETAKTAFAPLMADMKDIDTYLNTDLSKDAVSSLSGTIWKMGNAAKKADARLAEVNDQIKRTMSKMPQK